MLDDGIPRSIPLIIILLILVGGFFAGSETAFSYCNKIRMKRLAEEGDRRAKRVDRILDSFDSLLTTILIGTNACYVTASSLATVLFIALMGNTRGPVVATAVTTLAVFFFAETIPKNIARVNADSQAMNTSLVLRIITTLLLPVTLIFSGFSALISRLFGSNQAPTMTEDEFAAVVEDVEEDGLLEPEESALIQSAIVFADITAADIMIPVEQMVGIEVDESEESIREKVITQKFSRLPLYRGTTDNVIGVLREKELLRGLMRDEPLRLTRYMTPPYFIAPDMKLDTLFEEMGRHRTHIAFVMGENGICGFLTMEDILEELVGEIYDEDDVSVPGEGTEVLL